MKKRWLAEEFRRGYVFRRLDERAKVFIEYGKALLREAAEAAKYPWGWGREVFHVSDSQDFR